MDSLKEGIKRIGSAAQDVAGFRTFFDKGERLY
jgi:hypothetical protein